MASVASQLINEVTAHAQNDSLEEAREICADGTYFPNNLHNIGVNLCFFYYALVAWQGKTLPVPYYIILAGTCDCFQVDECVGGRAVGSLYFRYAHQTVYSVAVTDQTAVAEMRCSNVN